MLTPFPIHVEMNLCHKTDKDYKENRYQQQIAYCKRNVDTADRKRIFEKYHVDWDDRNKYTVDHIIPLSLGGSNLGIWPEHKAIRNHRRPLEIWNYWAIRQGCLGQREVLKVILSSKYNPVFILEKSVKSYGNFQNYLKVIHPKIWRVWLCD